MRRHHWPRALVVLAALAATLSALGQQADPVDAGKVEAASARVAQGDELRLTVKLQIEPGWHVYDVKETFGLPATIELDAADWYAAGVVTTSPEPHDYDASAAGLGMLKVHEGEVTITARAKVAGDATLGPAKVTGKVLYQVCDDSVCLEQVVRPFTVDVEIIEGEPDYVTVDRTEFVPARVRPGGRATLEIELGIVDGWHLSALSDVAEIRPSFVWETPDGVKADALEEVTKPHEIEQWGMKLIVHEGKLVLRQHFTVAADAKPGKVTVSGKGQWQRCDDKLCVTDTDVPLSASFEIAADGIDTSAAAALPPPARNDPAKPGSKGITTKLLLNAAGWGLLTLLTPCVFPLLPVTVSFFSKRDGPPLPAATVYGLGMVFTITVIGLVLKNVIDAFALSSAFNLFVGVVFVVLALSLFGLFDLRLPSGLINWSTGLGGASGLVGPFFMAVTLGLTSFSCSVPFLALMFATYDTGGQSEAIAGLLVYSGVMAAPFFVCSLIPALLKSMPRAGGWMNALKVTMGFVEFGFAFKFLRTVDINMEWGLLPRSLVLAIWTACALGAALYLLGFITLPKDTKVESIGVGRLLCVLLFLSMALYFLPGIFGRPLNPAIEGFIQTDAETELWSGGGGSEEFLWPKNDWDGALARAQNDGKPVLLAFTGVG